ncbi:Bug family tripartite tricarboxylate transporter substrate binding protein [Rhodovarius lipocyclicus]|uniref:Bug family tripartite tricarboxylate transporter substrate binding protein n=1 Tax=Rhodovarius lipocyclicus TaxID=268410 RepID=UPI00135C9D89|nr:tripartite tricarboxylate transporter substrate binding protein [Rhodovarius lipocyclicus]
MTEAHHPTRRRTALRLALGAFAAPTLATSALAQPWQPSQPIRILVGYPPGGAVDVLVRVVGEAAQRLRNLQVIPEVRSGAYGFLAAQGAARAAPDGTTLCSAIMGMMSVLPEIPGVPMPLDLEREIIPVAALAGTPMALVARPDAPFNDLDGLIAYAREKAGAATYASSGNGSTNHLGAALFAQITGVEMTHIPYRGGAPATLDVSAGRVDIMVANVAEVASQVADGRLKALGVTAAAETPMLPGAPPIAARFPQMEINNWFGLAGPAALPPAIREGLGAMFAAIVAEPTTREALLRRGLEPLPEYGAAFENRIRADRLKWRGVIRAANIRGD